MTEIHKYTTGIHINEETAGCCCFYSYIVEANNQALLCLNIRRMGTSAVNNMFTFLIEVFNDRILCFTLYKTSNVGAQTVYRGLTGPGHRGFLRLLPILNVIG